ncbi:uncharacterized protein IAS62_003325 [Cryptococcus decagattii]|uniref:Golgi to plasma membrane transport-related protein n=1 Tax=Cryptococcus decagattii TaxID=1859122 RepID=A0ABZ2AZQ5_9TREE
MDIDIDRWSEDERMDEDLGGEHMHEEQQDRDSDEVMGDGEGTIDVDEGEEEQGIDMDPPTQAEPVDVAPAQTSTFSHPPSEGQDVLSRTPELDMRAATPGLLDCEQRNLPQSSAADDESAAIEPQTAAHFPADSVALNAAYEQEVRQTDGNAEESNIREAGKREHPEEVKDVLAADSTVLEEGADNALGRDARVSVNDPTTDSVQNDSVATSSRTIIAPQPDSSVIKEERIVPTSNDVYEDDGEYDDEQEYYDDEPLTPENLPSIILHLPERPLPPSVSPARALFASVESDPGQIPVWLKNRQLELAEASLADVWGAIRAECAKEGLIQSAGDGLVITEKLMDLKMFEDDVNLQSITFLELMNLYHGCDLPEPVQLHLSWESSRFITRFSAIQSELEAARSRSTSEELVHDQEDQHYDEVKEHKEKKLESIGGDYDDEDEDGYEEFGEREAVYDDEPENIDENVEDESTEKEDRPAASDEHHDGEFEDADVNVDDTNDVSGPPKEDVTTSHQPSETNEGKTRPSELPITDSKAAVSAAGRDDNENKDDLVEIPNNSEADAGAVWSEESEEENPAESLLHEIPTAGLLQATERNQADLTSESVIDATSMPGDGQADFDAEAEDDGSLYENQVSLEPSTLSFDFRDKDSRVSKDASSSMTHLSSKVSAVQNTLSSSTMSDDAGFVLVSEPDKSTLIVEQAEQSSLSIVVEENNPENAETSAKMEVMVEETIKSVGHAGVGENDADHLSSRLQDGNDVGVMGDKTEEGQPRDALLDVEVVPIEDEASNDVEYGDEEELVEALGDDDEEGYETNEGTLDDDEENKTIRASMPEETVVNADLVVEDDGTTIAPKRSYDSEGEEGENKRTRKD